MPLQTQSTTHRLRNRLLIAVALFAFLALLTGHILEDNWRSLGPLGVLTLGAVFGAMTGVAIVLRRQWRLGAGSGDRPANGGLWAEALNRDSQPPR